MTGIASTRARFRRVAPLAGAPVRILVDGRPVQSTEGESVLAAMLSITGHVRELEANGEKRAGFCLMGACQDCWVWFGDAPRGRACTTLVRDGLEVFTAPPGIPPARSGA
ncbi:MAG: (2Fe-2S)-binding protein [Alphaproteobacteria bacterium]|nr:(2Fe-2S)-binding protein [Alphaproteobacteria bacterium]